MGGNQSSSSRDVHNVLAKPNPSLKKILPTNTVTKPPERSALACYDCNTSVSLPEMSNIASQMLANSASFDCATTHVNASAPAFYPRNVVLMFNNPLIALV